ncbi:MAG TPA: hypothetical protein PKW98_17740 [Candidatus Wallbacteria bacterium]|nr:hypothetical protein [Candidatus Wallbacteria bacterium]
MKINNPLIENISGGLKNEELKKNKTASDARTAPKKSDGLITNETKPQNLKSYSLTLEESETIINTLKESLNEINVNIENIFSNLNNENIFSVLKENN